METKGTLVAMCSFCGCREIVMEVRAMFNRPIFICRACTSQIEGAFRAEENPPETEEDRVYWNRMRSVPLPLDS